MINESYIGICYICNSNNSSLNISCIISIIVDIGGIGCRILLGDVY